VHVLADRDWVGFPQLLAGLGLCLAAAVLLLVSFGGGPPRAGGASSQPRAAAATLPPVTVRTAITGHGFRAAGARFRVVSLGRGLWRRSGGRLVLGAGQRPLLVAVEVVNLIRRGFDPGQLSYSLRGAHGTLIAPLRAGAVGPNSLATAGGLPRGAGAEVRLAFALPRRLHRVVLAIQPSARRALEIRVPLGSAQ
jgi:hypothetical protein